MTTPDSVPSPSISLEEGADLMRRIHASVAERVVGQDLEPDGRDVIAVECCFVDIHVLHRALAASQEMPRRSVLWSR